MSSQARALRLAPKAFDLLLALARRAGQQNGHVLTCLPNRCTTAGLIQHTGVLVLGLDVLIHEVYTMKTYNAVAAEARRTAKGCIRLRCSWPSLPNPEEAFLEEIRSGYARKVVVGHDVDIY